MELSTDYEFTAVTGDLFLSTLVPGPNTIIPPPYCADLPWGMAWRNPQFKVEPCNLESICARMQTWYCPKIPPDPDQNNENPLNIITATGETIKICINRSNFVIHLKEKIQDIKV